MNNKQEQQSKKSQTNNWPKISRIIDWTLLGTLIILAIYIRVSCTTEIITIETCEGEPNNLTQMQELQERGLVQKWTPKQNETYNKMIEEQAKMNNLNLTQLKSLVNSKNG